MATAEENHHRRKKKLIYKRFQYQFILKSIVTVIVILNFAVVIASLLFDFRGVAENGFIQPATLVIFELLVIGAVWFFTLGQSHKIAGPIFVFERSLRSVGEGDLTLDIRLRDDDQFQDTAHLFNTCVGSVRQHISEIQDEATALSGELAEGSEHHAAVQSLVEKLQWFDTGKKEEDK